MFQIIKTCFSTIIRTIFWGSIWTQIWTWLDSNPVFGFYGVEISIKYAGILFKCYIIILGGVGVQSHDDLDDAGGGGGGVQNWPKVDDVIYERSHPSLTQLVSLSVALIAELLYSLIFNAKV